MTTVVAFLLTQLAGWILLTSGGDKLSSRAERRRLQQHLASLRPALLQSLVGVLAGAEVLIGVWLILGVVPNVSTAAGSVLFGVILLGTALLARRGVQHCGCGGVLKESRIDARHFTLLGGFTLSLAFVYLARQAGLASYGPRLVPQLAGGQLSTADMAQFAIMPAFVSALFVRRFLGTHGPSILAVAREKVGDDLLRSPSRV